MTSEVPTLVSGRSTLTNRVTAFDVGDVLNETYEIGEVIAFTPTADLFAARDTVLGREVAIKSAPPTVGFGALRREARMLASFEHPGIIGAYGYHTHQGVEYLVLERLHGTTLAAYMELREGRGRFSTNEVLEIMLGIAESLAVIHSSGAVHGNL